MGVRADLKGIKTEIQSILIAANNEGQLPVDLSADLTERVREIQKIHPEMIQPQASFFPLVTCYIADKTLVSSDIARDQLQAQRRSRIAVTIVGTFWNDNFKSFDEDPADEDINYLMENIELILRGNPTLNGKVNWQRPTGVKYYTSTLDEQTHLRSGVMTLECELWY